MPALMSTLPDMPAAMPATVTTLVIAEQNRTYAESLSRICAEVFPKARTGIFFRATDALQRLRQEPADVFLQGLSFDDMDGVDLLNEVGNSRLARHTLVMTGRNDEHMLVSLRSARFNGAVDTASESIASVQQALQAILTGECYISHALRPILLDDLPGEDRAQQLTKAERRVLEIIGSGSENQEAADRLGLSVATVQTHRRNIMRKLKVSTGAKLVHEAVRLGVVRIAPAIMLHPPRRMLFRR